jgi:hypothetical protein
MDVVDLTLSQTEPVVRPGLTRRCFARLRRSVPTLATALAGSACWALVMATSALAGIWRDGWETGTKFQMIAMLFGLGAALAFPLGLTLARFVSLGKSAEATFAAHFLGLLLSTIGVTGALFALDYRQYYSTWHEEMFTVTWMFQFVFTMLGALGQFAVLGIRLFFPLGFAALVLASLWFARRAR